jgi:hypothetical protein
MPSRKITISKRLTGLSDRQIRQSVEIAINYFPDRILMEEIIRQHLEQANTIRLAIHQDRIVGYSVASKYKMTTPFYKHPINVIYQRMLYLQPGFLYKGLGLRLLAITMKDLFGWLWPFKRVAAICRTQNPVVARIMDMYNVSYPQFDQPVPDDVRRFAESLLPILGAESLDDQFRLIGTLSTFGGMDYTEIWEHYLDRRHNIYEQLMLSSVFIQQKGRIINSGAFMLVIAYARPLRFIGRLAHVWSITLLTNKRERKHPSEKCKR